MSFATVTFTFAAGACAGMYVAQEYNVPNVHWWLNETRSTFSRWEQRLRKRKERERARERDGRGEGGEQSW